MPKTKTPTGTLVCAKNGKKISVSLGIGRNVQDKNREKESTYNYGARSALFSVLFVLTVVSMRAIALFRLRTLNEDDIGHPTLLMSWEPTEKITGFL